MARTIQSIEKIKAWPVLRRAGFVLESFRGENGRVNCRGAVHHSGILIYKNEENTGGPWVLSITGEKLELIETVKGGALVDRLKDLRPALFFVSVYVYPDLTYEIEGQEKELITALPFDGYLKIKISI